MISAAIFVWKFSVSKDDIFFIPLFPVVIDFQVESLSKPMGVINPKPVTTTFFFIFFP